MNQTTISAICAVVVMLLPVCVCHAAPLNYECNILSEQKIGDDGILGPGHGLYVGKTFHVERLTGTVLGGGLGNSEYPDKRIISPGNSQMSYTVVWVSRPLAGLEKSHNSVFLEIKEWSDNFLKPFVLFTSGTVLTGTCK